jgi:hypothetical protein
MGLNPENAELELPSGMQCDNHLWLARQKGMGTNILEEIELVGDGAGAVSGVDGNDLAPGLASNLIIYPNFPNPFHRYTSFRYYTGSSGEIDLVILDAGGRKIATLYKGYKKKGEHTARWTVDGNPSGIYFCHLEMDNVSVTRKLIVN